MNGIILIDKKATWTSHDVVAKLRGVLGERRIGHSGTLDPMATGLLVVFLGRATRAVQFAESDKKTYLTKLRLGQKTDTQDTSGNILKEKPVNITTESLENALSQFRGDIVQIPPMYSAIKIGGKKLYELARKGKEVERKARPVTIFTLERLADEKSVCDLSGDLSADETAADIPLKIECSKGTYIRTICNDIGDVLGCGGCMSALRRTHAGLFSLENAHTLDEVIKAVDDGRVEDYILPTDTLFAEYPKLALTPAQEARVRDGGAFSASFAGGIYRSYSEDGKFLALSEAKDGVLTSIKSFYEV